MNTDYRMKIGFSKNRKTRRLVKRCGADGLLGLLSLIEYAAESRPDGDLVGLSDAKITDICEYDDGNFAAILRELEWLDGVEGECKIHQWAEHQPFVLGAAARSDRARKGGIARAAAMSAEEKTQHARNMLDARSSSSKQDKLDISSSKQDKNLLSTCTISISDSISEDIYGARTEDGAAPVKGNHVTESESAHGSDTKPATTARFVPPTVEQVETYFAERGYPGHGDEFCNHHQARGWYMSNRKRMVDWKAAVRTWIGNIPAYRNGTSANGRASPVGHQNKSVKLTPEMTAPMKWNDR